MSDDVTEDLSQRLRLMVSDLSRRTRLLRHQPASAEVAARYNSLREEWLAARGLRRSGFPPAAVARLTAAGEWAADCTVADVIEFCRWLARTME